MNRYLTALVIVCVLSCTSFCRGSLLGSRMRRFFIRGKLLDEENKCAGSEISASVNNIFKNLLCVSKRNIKSMKKIKIPTDEYLERRSSCAISARDEHFDYFGLQWTKNGIQCFGINDEDVDKIEESPSCCSVCPNWENYTVGEDDSVYLYCLYASPEDTKQDGSAKTKRYYCVNEEHVTVTPPTPPKTSSFPTTPSPTLWFPPSPEIVVAHMKVFNPTAKQEYQVRIWPLCVPYVIPVED